MRDRIDFGSGPSFGAGLDFGSGPDFRDAAEPLPDPATPEAPAGPVLQAIREREKAQRDDYVAATDSEFWIAVCFETREQKEEFLRRLALLDLGDKYLDGLEVAKRLGIPLESKRPKLRGARPKERLRKLV